MQQKAFNHAVGVHPHVCMHCAVFYKLSHPTFCFNEFRKGAIRQIHDPEYSNIGVTEGLLFSFFFSLKVPAVTSVHLVTTATPSNLEVSVCRASATTTLTPTTPSHVTPGLAGASGVCTTPTGSSAPSVSLVTMETPLPRNADVSKVNTF